MRKTTRLLIAISEIVSGGFLMIGTIFAVLMRVPVPGWYFLLAESFAVGAVIAGYRLTQNRAEGFTLSLYFQGLQLVQLLLPNLFYRVLLGPYLVIVLSMDKTLLVPGFKGELTLGWKGPSPGGIGFNFVAAVFFFLLSRAILTQRKEARAVANTAQLAPGEVQ